MGLVKVELGQVLFAPERYTQDQLEAAFAEVQDAEHWKNPINAWVPVEDLDLVREAVIHFTGSIIEEVDTRNGWVRVRADGYYIAIGA